jgi:hypothetical protein
MTKNTSRKNYHKKTKIGFFKNLRRKTSRAIPVVASGLKKVGSNVKNMTIKSKPAVEKGLGVIYKTVMSGLDFGLKGIKKGVRVIKSKTMSKTRRHK